MKPDDSQIRTARIGDATELARLSGELGYPVTAADMERRLAVLLASARHHVVVSERTGRLLGWMHVERRSSLEGGERAELMGLVVDVTARRRGLGRALVAVAEQWTREQGLPMLVVRSNVAREASHPFYEALGYARAKTQHVYHKDL